MTLAGMGVPNLRNCSLTISTLGICAFVVSLTPCDRSSDSTATALTLPVNCRPAPVEIGTPVMNRFPGNAVPLVGTVAEPGRFKATVEMEL